MKSISKTFPFIIATIALVPLSAGAVSNLTELIDTFGRLLNTVIPLIVGLAVVIFLYGIIKYITAGSDEGKRDEGRNTMIYGVIAIFVMVSVWGLVNVLSGTFNVENVDPDIPKIGGFETR